MNSPQQGKYAFVTFVDEEAKNEAMRVLNSHKFKGQTLIAIVSHAGLLFRTSFLNV